MMGDLKSLATATDDEARGAERSSPGLYVLAGESSSASRRPCVCDELLRCFDAYAARDIFTMLRSWEARHGSSGGLDKAGTPRLAVLASFFEIYANK
jgi:hypothetical protein